jgi:hypothetical protein
MKTPHGQPCGVLHSSGLQLAQTSYFPAKKMRRL